MIKTINNNKELIELFNFCNEKIFNNELPTIEVEWSTRMTANAGVFQWTKDRITKEFKSMRIALSVPYHKKFTDEIMDTLVHEMIHLKYPNDGHNSKFKREMERINKEFGMNLTQYSSGRATKKKVVKYECQNCGAIFNRQRRVKKGSTCGCSRKLGILKLISEK